MKIKVLFENKKGSTRFIDNYFDVIKGLIEKYPNALWRKYKSKNGQVGYEIDI